MAIEFNASSVLAATHEPSSVGVGASHLLGRTPESESRAAENSWSDMTADHGIEQDAASTHSQSGAHQLLEPYAHTEEVQAAWARPHEEAPLQVQHEAAPLEVPHDDAIVPVRLGGSVDLHRNMGPPADLSQEPAISAKLAEHGTPALRQKLDSVNNVVRQQYALLEPEVQAGLKASANKEKKITAANAGSTINHINDAVDNLRSSIAVANTPEELNKAISEYGKQSSMIGGSLGKTVLGASTLGVRQRSLQVAIAGGIGVGIAGIVPGVVSAVNSSRTANNTNRSNGNS